MSVIFADILKEDVAGDYRAYVYPLKAAYPYLSDDEWQLLLNQISTESNLLISKGNTSHWDLDESSRQALARGELIINQLYDRDEMAVFARISDTEVIRLSALQVEEPIYLGIFLIQFGVPLGLVALFALGVMLWQQYRLNKLEQTSLQFAQGELNARVPIGWLAVGKINQSFNFMAEKLERMFNSQKHMITAVSHELKTPLFRLQMQLNLIQDEPHSEQTGDYLTQMHLDIEEMDTLVGELLSFSKMERQDRFNDLIQTDVSHWLTYQVKQLARHCHHPIELVLTSKDLSPETLMQAIQTKQLKRALDNLVFNADRFAQNKIRISLFMQENQLCLSVEDDGIGIAEIDRGRIFEPFSRIDSDRNRDTGGFGLGLAIVKEIVRCHGASISVTKSELGGACFMISFET
ncbi:hypothetical protein HQQ94_18190 [Shewanella sp. VB17]|uniref:ATP-binding protein n=1 Tax=Shewanella sp. VB17 TaxID=2739432 RepID=UPI001563A10C|nr:ATP-binding protein [Shewanella sp. VB17]NRD75113.1 hypothetical protein [Shewanella sp. VB17]